MLCFQGFRGLGLGGCNIGFYRDNAKENGNYYLGFGVFRV